MYRSGFQRCNLGLTQTEQISDIWTEKSGIFHIFNPLKNQRYEARMGFPAPYQGDFKKQLFYTHGAPLGLASSGTVTVLCMRCF